MPHTFLFGRVVKLKICYNLLNYNEKRPYHDISDRAWANIEKLLPGSKGSIGRPSADNRLLITAVFWILRTGVRGGIYPQLLATEKIHIAASADGEIGAFGRKYSKLSLSNLILNASSLMPAIAKFIHMQRALREVMRP